MSVGGPSLEVSYTSVSMSGYDMKKVKNPEKKREKKKIADIEQVAAFINPSTCVNCGTCREACPVGAISEQQRIICHACPACTDKPGISPQEMERLAKTRSCTTGCPLTVSPQGYVGLVKAGKTAEALKLIWEKNPLPSVCGSVCHHPCEDSCKRGILVDSPIKIREIKKFLADTEETPEVSYQVLYEEKVAVIGAGPAGLTAGHYLSMAGYEVTVFESAGEAGGMLVRGIPQFRLSRERVKKDIERLEKAGLKIKTDCRISARELEKIREEYDAVIVATGAPDSKELQLPGYRLAGVMGAMSFMEQVNHGMELCRHLGQIFKFKDGEAVIIGGGSVAVDAARTALRVGASKVTVVCLESGNEVPAHEWEIREAKEDGVQFIEGYSPVEYQASLFPELQGVKFEKVTSLTRDENGRLQILTDKEQILEIKADWVVVAAGQTANPFWKNLKDDFVFHAGDVAGDRCSVVDAMASGRKAAIEVDMVLRGRRVKNPMESHTLTIAPLMEKIFPYNRRKTTRPDTPVKDVQERIRSFEETEGVFSREEAMQEASSCLKCGYQAVDPEKCIACGICQKLCPMGNVITLVAKTGGEEG